MTARTITAGVAHCEASGNSRRQNRIEGADLVEDADEQHRGGRAGLRGRVEARCGPAASAP